jgi:hypothetical protein
LTGQTCKDSLCVAGCELDEECPRFNRCEDGACLEVGCVTDRECVAATGSALSTCVATECRQPCETDLECAAVVGFNFRGCVGGFCEDLGCETDEECRIRLSIPQTSGDEAECRDVQ